MNILGLNADGYISSAALIQDGRVVAAAPEERFTRVKQDRSFPTNAIQFCLGHAGISMNDLDAITVGWNPAINIKRRMNSLSEALKQKAKHFYYVPNELFQLLPDKDTTTSEQIFHLKNGDMKIVYVRHHFSHISASYFLSPFRQAAWLVADGFGEEASVVMGYADGNRLQVLREIKFPQSMGMFYSCFTDYLGFRPDSDEWKVMALAALGRNDLADKFAKIISLNDDGTFELDLSYYNHFMFDREGMHTEKMEELFGPTRKRGEPLTQRHYDIAQGMQYLFEQALTKMLNWLHRETGADAVCASGGSFMNSVFNGKILQFTDFKQVFIPAFPDDSGVSIGSALYYYHGGRDGSGWEAATHNFYGPEFSNDQIKAELQKRKLPFRYVSEVERETAELIAQGNIVGWFQGPMEFGQRALGNRSILADPRRNDMKDLLNQYVKFREPFRPYAPAIMEEYVEEWFEIEPGRKVPFMESVHLIKPEKAPLIPAVNHYDGTGRVQTVSYDTNPSFYQLIRQFHKLTGVPIVLNTSLNINAMPIVCTPGDAIDCFFASGLDVLVMGNCIIDKKSVRQPDALVSNGFTAEHLTQGSEVDKVVAG